jgi:hypothetical protein
VRLDGEVELGGVAALMPQLAKAAAGGRNRSLCRHNLQESEMNVIETRVVSAPWVVG